MTELRVLGVFLGPDGRSGYPLGVVLDGAAVPAGRRVLVAAEPGFSETVFMDDAASGVGEAEATAAAAVMMGGFIRRPLKIRQGAGSVVHVRPGPGGTVEVGGRVEPVEVRELAG